MDYKLIFMRLKSFGLRQISNSDGQVLLCFFGDFNRLFMYDNEFGFYYLKLYDGYMTQLKL